MQELRLVAVSEDGSYLDLATAARGTRFTLPIDDRLRAVVRGHFSRLGQYEIDPQSGRQTEGQFESMLRFELTLPK